MGGKPAAGGGMRYQASASPAAAGPERKKIAEGKSRSRYAGANKAKDEAALAKKKLLGQ